MNTKERVLELLEDRRGEDLSGEAIANLLKLSRTSVWKAIRELRADGYDIRAATHRGYCLSAANDILSAQGLLPFLRDRSHADGIRVFPSLASTNETAKELALSGAGHGTVVMAERQTAGKGRYGRAFFSPPGGLYMSFVLRPEALPFENAAAVTMFAAVSVCEAIEAVTQKKPVIKWVNDILLDGRKICGILTEAVTDVESGRFQWFVLGVGLNFRARPEDYPEELRQSAGALFSDERPPITRNRLAAELISGILLPAGSVKEKDLPARYRSRLMTLGRRVTVVQPRETYEALAVDIDEAGHLIVKTDAGDTRTLSSGEARVRV